MIVAAWIASIAVNPARTSSSSSRAMLWPGRTRSVPATNTHRAEGADNRERGVETRHGDARSVGRRATRVQHFGQLRRSLRSARFIDTKQRIGGMGVLLVARERRVENRPVSLEVSLEVSDRRPRTLRAGIDRRSRLPARHGLLHHGPAYSRNDRPDRPPRRRTRAHSRRYVASDGHPAAVRLGRDDGHDRWRHRR